MNQIVKLTGIEAIGYHGVLETERENGQRFIVDCELDVEITQAVLTDSIEHAVDYAAVAELINSEIVGEPVNLIETLANRIALNILQKFLLVRSVEITVHKPGAPIQVAFTNVSVTVLLTSE